MLCHRATRAHNTILVNGMGQRIGTEGYGWIPRYYCSDKIGYVLGDASNAYGKVISPLWLERGKVSDVEYTPENGWDDVPLTKFRRHIVNLGKTGFIFIYDELEASKPADYTFMLHTTAQPMTVDTSNPRFVHVQGLSGRGGASDAYIFSTEPCRPIRQASSLFRRSTGSVQTIRESLRNTRTIGTLRRNQKSKGISLCHDYQYACLEVSGKRPRNPFRRTH